MPYTKELFPVAPPPPPLHLLRLEGLSREAISDWLDRGERELPIVRGERAGDQPLRGGVIANLFLEDSTRTRCSFEIAAKRLGADAINLSPRGSSVSKGETVMDTVATVHAMGVDAIVIRSPEPGTMETAAAGSTVPIINAGEASREHPTQGLLDALTLRQHFGELEGRRIAIVGDIARSRVARSNLFALPALGMEVRLIGPDSMLPRDFAGGIGLGDSSGRVQVDHALDPHLSELDAVMMLRVQFERGSTIDDTYRKQFALTTGRLARLPEHAVVLHPGPMNRGLEIDDAVADHPERSLIRQQVTHGVAIRMAVLRKLLAE